MSVIAHCDNLGVVAAVNSGYSKVDPIMQLLRCLFFIRAYFGRYTFPEGKTEWRMPSLEITYLFSTPRYRGHKVGGPVFHQHCWIVCPASISTGHFRIGRDGSEIVSRSSHQKELPVGLTTLSHLLQPIPNIESLSGNGTYTGTICSVSFEAYLSGATVKNY